MKNETTKRSSPQSSLMVEDDATERLKKRARDAGMIVNAGVGKAPKQPVAKKGEKDDAASARAFTPTKKSADKAAVTNRRSGGATPSPIADRSAAKDATLKAFRITYDNAHKPRTSRG